MKFTFTSDREMYDTMLETVDNDGHNLHFILLTKSNCYQLHRFISMEFDCICEDLTWDNELIFNTEIHTHKDLYENLFKLKFKGVQLGQES